MSDNEESKTSYPGDWELVETGGTGFQELRQRVPGGWLVLCMVGGATSMTFFPDPAGQWAPPIKQSRKKGFA